MLGDVPNGGGTQAYLHNVAYSDSGDRGSDARSSDGCDDYGGSGVNDGAPSSVCKTS